MIMAVPEIRYGMRPDANLFTRAEIGRYLRRFKMHLQAGASDSVVNLACEIREEIEQRKNADPDTLQIEFAIDDESLARTLQDRGIFTVGDAIRAGKIAIKRILKFRVERYSKIFNLCEQFSSTNYFE